MRKQSGFTLIELMVVMAIIAILATAGLSAYTGYIKKARDTKRIADVGAINTIVLGALGADGAPPSDSAALDWLISEANNGQRIKDPLENEPICLGAIGSTDPVGCSYTYITCDDGTGYAISTTFESQANQQMYLDDAMDADYADAGGLSDWDVFEVGSCKKYDYPPTYIAPSLGD